MVARPSHCPPVNSSPDACEMQYSVDIPLIGRDTVGVPIYQMVDDALKSATQQLPQYLPTFYQQLKPYVAAIEDDLVRTMEYELPFLADDLMADQVDPRIDGLLEDVTGKVEVLKDEVLATVLATGAALVVAFGVGIWYLKQR